MVELLCKLGQLATALTKDAVVGDWSLIALYYLLCIGKYSEKDTRQESKQTVEFCMKDVPFFEFNATGDCDRCLAMPRKR